MFKKYCFWDWEKDRHQFPYGTTKQVVFTTLGQQGLWLGLRLSSFVLLLI